MRLSIFLLIIFSPLLLSCKDNITLVNTAAPDGVSTGTGSDGPSTIDETKYFQRIEIFNNRARISDGTSFHEVSFSFDADSEYMVIDRFEDADDWRINPIFASRNYNSDKIKIYQPLTGTFFEILGTYENARHMGEWEQYSFFKTESLEGDFAIWRTDGTISGTTSIDINSSEMLLQNGKELYLVEGSAAPYSVVKLDLETFNAFEVVESGLSNNPFLVSHNYILIEKSYEESFEKAFFAGEKLYDFSSGTLTVHDLEEEFTGLYDVLRLDEKNWKIVAENSDGLVQLTISENLILRDDLGNPYDAFLLDNGLCLDEGDGWECATSSGDFSIEEWYGRFVMNDSVYHCGSGGCYILRAGAWEIVTPPINENAFMLAPWMQSRLNTVFLINPYGASSLLIKVGPDDVFIPYEINNFDVLLNKYVEPKDKKKRYNIIQKERVPN